MVGFGSILHLLANGLQFLVGGSDLLLCQGSDRVGAIEIGASGIFDRLSSFGGFLS
jgi:hypothetical protein